MSGKVITPLHFLIALKNSHEMRIFVLLYFIYLYKVIKYVYTKLSEDKSRSSGYPLEYNAFRRKGTLFFVIWTPIFDAKIFTL